MRKMQACLMLLSLSLAALASGCGNFGSCGFPFDNEDANGEACHARTSLAPDPREDVVTLDNLPVSARQASCQAGDCAALCRELAGPEAKIDSCEPGSDGTVAMIWTPAGR